jgi:hypothetical protein
MKFVQKAAISAALLGATVAGGAVGAVVLTPASAQSTSTTAPATATAPVTPTAPATDTPRGPHQANGKTETLLTGDDLAKVTAAVAAQEPGATIDRAETDADGAVYEAHITKADGSKATVKFDASFAVTSVDAGMS